MKTTLIEKLTQLKYTGKNGLYSAAIPDKYTEAMLVQWTRLLKLPNVEDGLHVTISYSKDKSIGPKANADVVSGLFIGRLKEITTWIDHKDRKIVVAVIDSKDLTDANKKLQSLGAEHSFADYTTHVTLAKIDKNIDLDQKALEKIYSTDKEKIMVFKDAFIGDIG